MWGPVQAGPVNINYCSTKFPRTIRNWQSKIEIEIGQIYLELPSSFQTICNFTFQSNSAKGIIVGPTGYRPYF